MVFDCFPCHTYLLHARILTRILDSETNIDPTRSSRVRLISSPFYLTVGFLPLPCFSVISFVTHGEMSNE